MSENESEEILTFKWAKKLLLAPDEKVCSIFVRFYYCFSDWDYHVPRTIVALPDEMAHFHIKTLCHTHIRFLMKSDVHTAEPFCQDCTDIVPLNKI